MPPPPPKKLGWGAKILIQTLKFWLGPQNFGPDPEIKLIKIICNCDYDILIVVN